MAARCTARRATRRIRRGSRTYCSTARRSESARRFARRPGSITCAAPISGGARAFCSVAVSFPSCCACCDPIGIPYLSFGVDASISCAPCSRASLTVGGQLQIPAADQSALLVGTHRPFPVDCAGGKPRVVLLIVEQGLQVELPAAGADAPLHGVGDSRSR